MDTVKYLKEILKMCKSMDGCGKCPIRGMAATFPCKAAGFTEAEVKDPDGIVKVVEKWSAEHPPKTRQSEFLKLFPDACIEDGMIQIAPCMIDQNKYPKVDCIKKYNCEACCRDYWLQEVE